MLKRSIGLGLLFVAGHAYSDNITVTTTEDIVKDDKQCSLREAVEYVNQGLPEKGYFGCGGKDATAVILLAEKAEYQLNQQLQLKKSVQIKTTYESSPTEESYGVKNATIKAGNNARIFLIEKEVSKDKDKEQENLPVVVILSEINLTGCTQTQCVDQGGLILNKQNLTLQYVNLQNGKATQGGAIYNAYPFVLKEFSSNLVITNSLLQGNKAQQGGVIYSEYPNYKLSNSVIKNNEVSNGQAALFDVKNPWSAEDVTSNNSFIMDITNSTFFANKGYVIRVVDAMLVNNITMIRNTAGLLLNAPSDKAIVANSILAENGSSDCTIVKFNPKFLQTNTYGQGCTGTNSTMLKNVQLIAGTSVEGKCDLNTQGVLCPFSTPKDKFLGYFKPRLLPSYTSISQSPFVNRGPFSNLGLMTCLSTDQRGQGRPNYEMCDIGAIELVVNQGNVSTIGDDILYGEKATMNIADQLGDGELLPAAQCQALLGESKDKQPWKIGCMQVVQTNTISKGTSTVLQDGTVNYVPNSNWHGSDEFKIQIVTTTTRFDDSKNPYIDIPVRIVQSPPNTFEDKSVKTSGGSAGLGGLLGLLGLLGLRQLSNKRKTHEKL